VGAGPATARQPVGGWVGVGRQPNMRPIDILEPLLASRQLVRELLEPLVLAHVRAGGGWDSGEEIAAQPQWQLKKRPRGDQ
jgi:hypothetical protein